MDSAPDVPPTVMDDRSCHLPHSFFYQYILNQSLYNHAGLTADLRQLMEENRMTFSFRLEHFYFCISGIKKSLYNRLYGWEPARYTALYADMEAGLHTLLTSIKWAGDIFLVWKEEEKQIAVIMSPQEGAVCDAQAVCEAIDAYIQAVYEREIFRGDTRYRNTTSLSGPLSGNDAIRKGYDQARALNDLSFLRMEARVITQEAIDRQRNDADYPTVLDACFELRSYIDEGNDVLAREHLRRLFLETISRSYSLSLCDDALSFIKSTLQIRCSVYRVATEVPLDALCERKRYHRIEDCTEALERVVLALCAAVQAQGVRSKSVLSAQYYISMHYDRYLTLTDIARYTNTNACYLSSRFKEETGLSVRNYINAVRIEAARMLLRSTQDTVIQISSRVGFEDVRYFTRVFKQAVGCTPTEYRHGRQANAPRG